MLDYLKLCTASILDQSYQNHEHIIIDAESNDGTVEWLKQQSSIQFISEKDKGMYDAINKGFQMCSGDIISYLNCDEQYLPGTLEFVQDFFKKNSDVDVLFGDFLITKPDGSLISYRKSIQPKYSYIISSYLYVFTCTMFFRKKVLDDGVFFNIDYRDVGDEEFVLRLLKKGYKIKHIKKYFSIFTITGKNMCMSENSILEKQNLLKHVPKKILRLKLLLNIFRLIEKFFSGAYFQKFPLQYSIYPLGENCRKTFKVQKATFLFPND